MGFYKSTQLRAGIKTKLELPVFLHFVIVPLVLLGLLLCVDPQPDPGLWVRSMSSCLTTPLAWSFDFLVLRLHSAL